MSCGEFPISCIINLRQQSTTWAVKSTPYKSGRYPNRRYGEYVRNETQLVAFKCIKGTFMVFVYNWSYLFLKTAHRRLFVQQSVFFIKSHVNKIIIYPIQMLQKQPDPITGHLYRQSNLIITLKCMYVRKSIYVVWRVSILQQICNSNLI